MPEGSKALGVTLPFTEFRAVFISRPFTFWLRLLLTTLVVMIVAACAGAGPTPDTYDLALPANVEDIRGGTSAQILVREPRALAALSTNRIIVRASPIEVTLLGGVQLPDRLPIVVQARLIEAFELSDGARAVGAPGDGLLIDFTVSTQIRKFEIEAFNGGRAIVEISAKLINERNGRVVASEMFSATAPATASSTTSSVEGINAAFGEIVTDIVSWTYRRI